MGTVLLVFEVKRRYRRAANLRAVERREVEKRKRESHDF